MWKAFPFHIDVLDMWSDIVGVGVGSIRKSNIDFRDISFSWMEIYFSHGMFVLEIRHGLFIIDTDPSYSFWYRLYSRPAYRDTIHEYTTPRKLIGEARQVQWNTAKKFIAPRAGLLIWVCRRLFPYLLWWEFSFYFIWNEWRSVMKEAVTRQCWIANVIFL